MTPIGGGRSTRRAVLGAALIMLGLASGLVTRRLAITADWQLDPLVDSAATRGSWLTVLAVAVVLLVVGGLLVVTGVFPATRTAAALRLDWYVPFLRKKKAKETLTPAPWVVRLASRVLPTSWLADRVTGKPGAIRRLLKRLGPSVLSSPLRRTVQAVCLVLFAVILGLAIVNQQTCLPLANREACQLCVDECVAAGYDAIEFTRVHTQIGDDGLPIEASGFLAPVVLADKCVGCGLCQTRCHLINVKEKHLLRGSAIVIEAGPDKEDRLRTGSYVALREIERTQQEARRLEGEDGGGYFVPALESETPPLATPDAVDAENPFGLP